MVRAVSTSSQSWKVTVMDTLTRQQTLSVASGGISTVDETLPNGRHIYQMGSPFGKPFGK